MPISPYVKGIRRKIGNDLLLMPSVSVVVRDDEGRILLARHAYQNIWAFPGGAIDPEEHPYDAGVREIKEETGLDVEITRIISVHGGPEFSWSYANGDRVNYVIIALEARLLGGAMEPDGEEVLELRYFSVEEIEELGVWEWMHVVLREVAGQSHASG